MGSILYDFLAESFLFDQRLIDNSFANVSEVELLNECHQYRDFCLKNFDGLVAEIAEAPSDLRVFSGVKETPLDLLKQSAFYIEQFVLCDPLFAEVPRLHKPSVVMRQYLGFTEEGLDRKSLATVLSNLKELQPMIAANFVKLFPTSYFFEPADETPIFYSKQNYTEGIPDALIGFFHSKAKVLSMERVKDGYALLEKLYPCRNIAVEFEGQTAGEVMLFQLFENEVISTNKEERTAEVRMILPETPPDEPQFRLWVEQSINRAAKNSLGRAIKEAQFATKLNSVVLTKSKFVSELFHQTIPTGNGITTHTASTLLKLKLPFLDNVNISTLMNVRENDGESFQNFRKELEKQFRELRLIVDPDQLRIKTENVLHELSEVQVRQVQQKVTHLKRKSLVDAGIAIAGLAGSIQTGGWSLLASAVAAVRGYQTRQEYVQSTRQNPAFFLWQVLNK